jgi:glycosyltransferase involved in cell wall biosynthesis
MAEPFALLLTVYGGDRAAYLRYSFHSVVHAQTRRPDQVILVQDGPVPADLADCMKRLIAESPVPVRFLPLERNGGLGHALDTGLAASRYDVVARMDADDIALPRRFEVQLPVIEQGADLVGAGMLEIGSGPDDVVGRRTPIADPAHLSRYARLHDPFNHPTIVYRRSAVEEAGGYGDLPLMEDYWLFARMIAAGAEVVNLTEPLVYYRVGDGAYERRGGGALLRAELRLQRELLRHGFTTRPQSLRNVAVRGTYRLVPAGVRRPLYRRFVAPRGERRSAP